MLDLPDLSPEEVYHYMQLRWKLDVIETYLSVSCGLYGCQATKKICPSCEGILKQKFHIMNEIFMLSGDEKYKRDMEALFKNLVEKLSYVRKENPDLLECRGVHPDTLNKRKAELLEKFKYLKFDFININHEFTKLYECEEECSTDRNENPLR